MGSSLSSTGGKLNLSPNIRVVLTVLAAGVAALGAALTTVNDVPDWVGIAIAVLSAMFGALNIVPPQVGGTQQGVVNPDVKKGG